MVCNVSNLLVIPFCRSLAAEHRVPLPWRKCFNRNLLKLWALMANKSTQLQWKIRVENSFNTLMVLLYRRLPYRGRGREKTDQAVAQRMSGTVYVVDRQRSLSNRDPKGCSPTTPPTIRPSCPTDCSTTGNEARLGIDGFNLVNLFPCLTSFHHKIYSPQYLVFGKAVQIRHYPVTVSTEN